MHVPECMYVQHMVTDVMQSEDVRCPRTKVTGNYELPSMVLGTEPRSQKKVQKDLTDEPAL